MVESIICRGLDQDSSDEILQQLVGALNEMMDRHKETRRRCAQLQLAHRPC